MTGAILAQYSYYSSSPILSIIAWGLFFVGLGGAIYALVDANKYPDPVWQAAGQNKVLWMVLTIASPFVLCCFCLGWLGPLLYFLIPKKSLDAAQAGGAGGGYAQPYGAQPGYGAPPAQPGYGAPPAQPGYGAPPAQPGYGAPPAQPGYQQPPPAQPGYGVPDPGYTPPPAPPGYPTDPNQPPTYPPQ